MVAAARGDCIITIARSAAARTTFQTLTSFDLSRNVKWYFNFPGFLATMKEALLLGFDVIQLVSAFHTQTHFFATLVLNGIGCAFPSIRDGRSVVGDGSSVGGCHDRTTKAVAVAVLCCKKTGGERGGSSMVLPYCGATLQRVG